ncbi:MAG: hypothetical protein WD061_02120 [Candidatus Saccharimonadales bacterium]
MSDSEKPHKLSDLPAYDQVGGNSNHGFNNGPMHGKPTLASKITVITAIFAAIVLLGAIIASTFIQKNEPQDYVKTDQYQAVFLSSGQVYFGQIAHIDSELVILRDIFYLNADQDLQDIDGETSVSLTKLGSELHGPEDEMFISARDILFWENLKDDSTVVQAITQYYLDEADQTDETDISADEESSDEDATTNEEDGSQDADEQTDEESSEEATSE